MSIHSEALSAIRALREWINAVPADVAAALPAMPGVDGDWLDKVEAELSVLPEFSDVAARKLQDLQERGYTVTGYAIEKPEEGGQPSRGFINAGGFVGWWRGDALEEPRNASQASDPAIKREAVQEVIFKRDQREPGKDYVAESDLVWKVRSWPRDVMMYLNGEQAQLTNCESPVWVPAGARMRVGGEFDEWIEMRMPPIDAVKFNAVHALPVKSITVTQTLAREEVPDAAPDWPQGEPRAVARMDCPMCKGDSGYFVLDTTISSSAAKYLACSICDAGAAQTDQRQNEQQNIPEIIPVDSAPKAIHHDRACSKSAGGGHGV